MSLNESMIGKRNSYYSQSSWGYKRNIVPSFGFPDGKECGEPEDDSAEGHQDGLEPKGR